VATGLRAAEIASLRLQSFDLDADPPTVTVEGRHAKNRRIAIQPIARSLADKLTPFLASRIASEPIWRGKWYRPRAAEIIRADLAACGVDCDGRDFHCLRHSYVSALIRSGASVKTVQTLARHSTPTLTLGRYAHAGLCDLQSALDAMSILVLNQWQQPELTGKNLAQTLACCWPKPEFLGDELRRGPIRSRCQYHQRNKPNQLNCARRDLNSHGFPHWILSGVRHLVRSCSP
jgi:Phage integrase family